MIKNTGRYKDFVKAICRYPNYIWHYGRLQSTTDCVYEQSNFVDLTDDISVSSDKLDIIDLGNSSQEIHLPTLLIPNDEESDKNVFIEEETSSLNIKDSFSYDMEEFPFDESIT